MQQRTDIQGLRAYAVIAVLLYHFGVPGFSGGFIGVDVFFVISGFLMTAIILRGIENKRFSLTHFYLSRARRIIPALALVCISLLALGWFYLPPLEYKQLGTHTSGAMGFYSNFIFMDEEGYFDAPSKTKWLLHTWSLSVEWQFYMLYPLILLASGKRAKHVVVVLAVASLLAAILVSPRGQAQAFYLLTTRAWELLAGALVYLYAPRLPRAAEWLGIACILASAYWFTALLPWPKAYALLPVIGAMLVLASARQHSLLTANPLAQMLGRWSYSMYLWHWPVVVALGYFSLQSSGWIICGIALSLLLGFLSYHFIEYPTRNLTRRHTILALSACCIIAIAGAGLWVAKAKGIPARVPESIQRIEYETKNRYSGSFASPCGFDKKTLALKPCVLGDAKNIRWALWGDSHAGMVMSALQEATGKGVATFIHSCATVFDAKMKSKSDHNRCPEFNRAAWEHIQQLPPHVGVIIMNRYAPIIKGANESASRSWGLEYTDGASGDDTALYRERFTHTLCEIAKKRSVYVIKPTPEFGASVPKTMAHQAMRGLEPQLSLPLTDYYARNDIVLDILAGAAKRCGVKLLDPIPYLCDKNTCSGERGGIPIYSDDNHLSETGNRLLLPMFKKLAP